VEAWTEEIRSRARDLLRKIDGLGGAVAAIEQGFLAREIEEAAYAAQREVEEGSRTVVGVNAFREEEDVRPPLLTIDPAIERDQIERLAAFKARRDAAAVETALDSLERDAREDRNVMPAILTGVTAGATLGEAISRLKSVYGEHRPGG